MSDPPDNDPDRDGDGDGRAEAVTVGLVGEQLRAARAEVFRAYLQAQDKARGLVEEEDARGADGGRR